MAGARSNNITESTVAVTFPGINSVPGTNGVRGFVSDNSSTGNAAGNGDYHITSASTALNLVPSGSAKLSYDLDGVARKNDGTGAAGAYEYIPPVVVPTLTTSLPTTVATSSFTLNANISDTGGGSIVNSGFAYGTVADLSTVIATTSLGSQSGAGNFSGGVTGLNPNTLYYFRAYAANYAGLSSMLSCNA